MPWPDLIGALDVNGRIRDVFGETVSYVAAAPWDSAFSITGVLEQGDHLEQVEPGIRSSLFCKLSDFQTALPDKAWTDRTAWKGDQAIIGTQIWEVRLVEFDSIGGVKLFFRFIREQI